jgi:hypothetical protein
VEQLLVKVPGDRQVNADHGVVVAESRGAPGRAWPGGPRSSGISGSAGVGSEPATGAGQERDNDCCARCTRPTNGAARPSRRSTAVTCAANLDRLPSKSDHCAVRAIGP